MSRPSKSDKRKDKDGYVLRKGESQKKGDGRYVYTYTDGYKKRRYVYARTLVELRELEKKIRDDMTFDLDYSAASRMTLNDLFDRYIKQKYNLKPSTKLNYINNYRNHVRGGFGKKRIVDIRYTDIKVFYHELLVDKKLSISTVENINNAIHPAFKMAIRDQLLIRNPTDDIMGEIKKSKEFKSPEKRIALSIPEQKSFMQFLYNSPEYKGWYPIIAVLVGTGMRISSFFILPSSIHELLIIPDNGNFDLKSLENMVKEVNATTVDPADQLTDNVYHYDAQAKVFELGEKFVERQAEKDTKVQEASEKKSLLGDLKAAKDEAVKAPHKDAADIGSKTKGEAAL